MFHDGTKPEGDDARDAGASERPIDPGETPREVPPPPRKRPFVIALLIVAALLSWGAYGHWTRQGARAETQQNMRSRVPKVRTVEAKRDGATVEVILPGQTDAYETANLYARATGYIAERYVDIGSRVRKGDRLARIAAPDLDQQLEQATAQLGQIQAQLLQANAQVDQAKANVNLANVTNSRTSTLAGQGWETKQNADTAQAGLLTQGASLDAAQAGVKVAEANVKAQQATVDRLKALAAFENVVAPFDGVVTSRSAEVGNLVGADSSSGVPLFSMSRDDILRITVQVPQNEAVGIRNGLDAAVRVPQMPGLTFGGIVARSSVALLYSSRTLTTEVDVPNTDRLLRPGLYVYVSLAVPREHPTVSVPAETLIFNQNGMQVAVLDGDTVRMRPVVVERDLGTTVSLRDGLSGGEHVIVSPPASLSDGGTVKTDAGDPGAERSEKISRN